MYDKNQIDAVIISTADFQHALHTVQAANAKKDVYVEKPFAETMEDARLGKKAANDAGIVLQVGSQRRSGKNYHAADKYIKSRSFWRCGNGRNDMECKPTWKMESIS